MPGRPLRLHSGKSCTSTLGATLTAIERLPLRLKTPTAEEALFEVRFTPTTESAVSLLPGLLFGRLTARYPKQETYPLASLPIEFRRSQPELKYAQQVRLTGEDGYSLFVGDCVAGASTVAPYPGWDRFRDRILPFVAVLRESNLLRFVERISFKYVNLLSLPAGRQLEALDMSVMIDGRPSPETGFVFRVELNGEGFTRIIEVGPNSGLKARDGSTKEGMVLALDAIKLLPDRSRVDALTPELVESVHLEAKKMFFRMITLETLESLGPVYE